MFHVADNLFFERVPSDQGYGIGAVRILKRESPDGPVIFAQVIDADGWASVVASMSHLGEDGTTWALFKVLQQGGFIDDSAIKTRGTT